MYSWQIDTDERYSVLNQPKVAWYVKGPSKTWTEESWEIVCEDDDCDHASDMCYVYREPEEEDDEYMVDCVMVGDDRVFSFYADDLTILPEDEFCSGCGQIGCGWS